MDILPTTPADFSGANSGIQIQTGLLSQAQDLAQSQMSQLMESISPPSAAGQGTEIDVKA